MPHIDTETLSYARLVRGHYEGVFNETPDMAFHFLPGQVAIVVADWLWIFPAGVDDRWVVRSVLPPGDEWFRRYSCMLKADGREVEKKCFNDAMVHLLALESHRRFHAADLAEPVGA